MSPKEASASLQQHVPSGVCCYLISQTLPSSSCSRCAQDTVSERSPPRVVTDADHSASAARQCETREEVLVVLTSGSTTSAIKASRTARPAHASMSATCSGVMKSCDVRDANTICAAAARMRGGGLSGWVPSVLEDAATSGIRVCEDGAWLGAMEGAVGA